jgi:hypothetical protein
VDATVQLNIRRTPTPGGEPRHDDFTDVTELPKAVIDRLRDDFLTYKLLTYKAIPLVRRTHGSPSTIRSTARKRLAASCRCAM